MAKWTDDEEKYLLNNVSTLSIEELSIALNKNKNSIRTKKNRMGIVAGKHDVFTDYEKDVVIGWYEDHQYELNLGKLSETINRPITSICRFAKKNNLTDRNRIMAKNKNRIKRNREEYFKSDDFKISSSKGIELFTWMSKNNHYRGMLGKHHSPETKMRQSEKHKEIWKNKTEEEKNVMINRLVLSEKNRNSVKYSNANGGIREDLNQYFRSSWEANIARYLNFFNIEWKYEFKRFKFNNEINGVLSYLPDFYLPKYDLWIEIKGWMNERSSISIELFKKYYPKEYSNFILIGSIQYYQIEYEYGGVINNWESYKNKRLELPNAAKNIP